MDIVICTQRKILLGWSSQVAQDEWDKEAGTTGTSLVGNPERNTTGLPWRKWDVNSTIGSLQMGCDIGDCVHPPENR